MLSRRRAPRVLAGSLALALSVFGLLSTPVVAQPEPSPDALIAAGNPPLTERMVEQYANLQGWILEVPVSKEFLAWQRADLKGAWSNSQLVNAVLGMLADAARLTPDDREFYRVDAQQHILASLRTQSAPAAQFYLTSFAAAHAPIAPGSPALTESMVSHYVAFVGWLLEIPVTDAFAADQRARLLRDWKNPRDAEGSLRVLQWQLKYAELKGGGPERDYARTVDQPAWISQMRGHPDNPDNQAVLAPFDAAHRSLAAGKPALTRQASDAWAELYCFIRNQGLHEGCVANPSLKNAFAAQLAGAWPTYNAERRKWFSDMPNRWAGVRWLWTAGQDADRAKIVTAWLPIVNPPPPPDAQLAAAMKALARTDAFLKKDPSTVSSREMLQAAADEDLMAAQYRRQGAPALAANADALARTLHTGSPQAYANLVAQQKANAANNDALAIARAQYSARNAMMGARFMSNVMVSGDAAMANVITNINHSPYQTIVVPVNH
jgi:hypothetical protein